MAFVTGTVGADSLNGESGSDIIYGGPETNPESDTGNDTLTGGLGNDVLKGFGGNDVLYAYGSGGGYTVEYLDGGDGNDTLWGDPGSKNTFVGGLGNDVMNGNWNSQAGATELNWVDYSGAGGFVTVDLGNPNSQSTTSAGSDTIKGIANIIGSAFGDFITGHDTAVGELHGRGGKDFLSAGNAAVAAFGEAGQDVLRGSGLADTLSGGDDDDQLVTNGNSSTTPDLVDGGDGNDIVFFTDAPAEVIVRLDLGQFDSEGWGLVSTTSVEGAVGSVFDDILVGTTGQNYLSGNPGDDALFGLEGSDTLSMGTGNDTVIGGPGFDTLTFIQQNAAVTANLDSGDGGDVISGVEGLEGSSFDDRLTGNAGNNSLWGGSGVDTLAGGDGDDQLRGGVGADRMNGGNGNDQFFVDDPGDQTIETNADPAAGGIDTTFTTVDGSLGGNVENLRLQGTGDLSGKGNALNNNIQGNTGANLLQGLAGNDTIDGREGADTIDGGGGNDTLSGGPQGDVFRFANTSAGVDRILDFSRNGDHFDLSGGSFTALSIAPNGDAVLTHDGGTVRIANPPNLTLAQWNALVLPSGMTSAPTGTATSGDSGVHATATMFDAGEGHTAALPHNDIVTLARGDWIFA